ncbi:hypothetical protein JCGZ_22519 [Jatropha curcas]|uniref:Uncharacterized protein n=2 Tax=Jatropha curcas TaxID=180498 RepID=A0A067JPK1_JATCU|nr:hypothetical protein JCGZ_22519 [Jatropha curcas]
MDKKNKNPKRNSSIHDDNDISIVKAAAWAWYQHGSGSDEEKLMREFDVYRTPQAPKPSRYKLEAMDKKIKESTTHTNNSLLDAYEIASISKRLDDLIIESRNSSIRFYDRTFNGDQESIVSMSSPSPDGSYSSNSAMKSKKKKKRFLKGLWLRHPVVCGTTKDVDTKAFVRRTSLAAGNLPGSGNV